MRIYPFVLLGHKAEASKGPAKEEEGEKEKEREKRTWQGACRSVIGRRGYNNTFHTHLSSVYLCCFSENATEIIRCSTADVYRQQIFVQPVCDPRVAFVQCDSVI